MKFILSAAFALTLSLPLTVSGQWAKNWGEAYIKLSQQMLIADQLYTDAGDLGNITTTGVHISSLYLDLGLGKNLSFEAFLPFLMVNTLNNRRFQNSGVENPGGSIANISDPILGLQYQFLGAGSFALSASATVSPAIGQRASTDLDDDETGILSTSDGETNVFLNLRSGYSFYPLPMYAKLQVGLNVRSNGFSEEFRLGGEFGYFKDEVFLLALKAELVESFRNGNASAEAGGVFSNNTEFFVIGPELSVFVWKQYGLVGGALFGLSGANILAAPAYQFGIFADF